MTKLEDGHYPGTTRLALVDDLVRFRYGSGTDEYRVVAVLVERAYVALQGSAGRRVGYFPIAELRPVPYRALSEGTEENHRSSSHDLPDPPRATGYDREPSVAAEAIVSDVPSPNAPAGCAACDGDPEAHGLHVCGKEPFA